MRNLYFLVLVTLFSSACNSSGGGKKSTTVTNESEGIRIDASCLCEDLIQVEGVSELDGKPFTGVCESWIAKDSAWGYKFEEIQFFEGVKHGKAKVFDQEGILLEEYLFKNGVKASMYVERCPCEELTEKVASDNKKYYYRMNNLFTGSCYTKYPHIDQILQVKMIKKGMLAKDSIFDQEGGLLTVSEYNEGVLITH